MLNRSQLLPILVVLALVPPLYLLSFIPLGWALNHRYLTPSWWDRVRPFYAALILYLRNNGNPQMRKLVDDYAKFLDQL